MLYVGDCLAGMRALDAASVDAIVTDPPYELGFMGRKWDSSGIAYSVDVWREALRVLKPGGHLLAFGGTRTYHRMACAIEDAGFEVRDSIHWIYGSGFPKSLDVSKAIDKARDDRAFVLAVTAFVRDARDAAGKTNAEIDAVFGTHGMAGHWTSAASQPCVPTWEQWEKLRAFLGFGDELDAEVWRLNGRKGTPGENWAKREVVGYKRSGIATPGDVGRHTVGGSATVEVSITAPATDAARNWSGFGTALKPAHEPIVVARKPLDGTVASNVLAHGTGAINVDGCRVGYASAEDFAKLAAGVAGIKARGGSMGNSWKNTSDLSGANDASSLGRWPPNILLTHSVECGEACAEDCPVVEMDRQSDPGGASRFFPCFRYEAKASRRERDDGLRDGGVGALRDGGVGALRDGGRGSRRFNPHPTVKPIALMRWLVRLVTPPGGLVLDPFAGSGTTGVACIAEGVRFVGCELMPEHAEIIMGRMRHAIEAGVAAPKPKKPARAKPAKPAEPVPREPATPLDARQLGLHW